MDWFWFGIITFEVLSFLSPFLIWFTCKFCNKSSDDDLLPISDRALFSAAAVSFRITSNSTVFPVAVASSRTTSNSVPFSAAAVSSRPNPGQQQPSESRKG